MRRKRGLAPRPLPTPDEIAHAPELVALHALEEILELTLRALVAAHPELTDAEAPFWAREASRATRKAEHVVAIAHRLQQHLRAYRTAIPPAPDQRLETDPEAPF